MTESLCLLTELRLRKATLNKKFHNFISERMQMLSIYQEKKKKKEGVVDNNFAFLKVE